MNASPTILIVDDNPINLKLAADVLECDDYAVLRATSAKEAQLIMTGAKPDLILMDIQMPEMDGLTFTRLIRKNPRFTDVLIVAMTAFAMKGDDQKAFDAGCDSYITKPIETRTFSSQIEAIINRGPLPVPKAEA